MTPSFAPGDLVRARGREWVSLPSSLSGLLCLRPLTGSEADIQILDPTLELEPAIPARFDLPRPDDLATQDAARLLTEALHLHFVAAPDLSGQHLVSHLNLVPISWFHS